MQIRIDNASGRPVYQQIIDQVKRDIALGRLVKDEKLATVRQLAGQLAINPNTIAKAYRQLEQEGIIVTRPGAGAFVANLDSNLSKAVKKRVVCEELERIVVEAFHMQIDGTTLLEWFNDAIEKFNLPPKEGRTDE
ncbi:MAG TPA: GntR family transcriptional regulator [Sedimentisphaerales bacterium]|nr:GntR family transcriptional regulator [Sedimentisphaerales bacterium]